MVASVALIAQQTASSAGQTGQGAPPAPAQAARATGNGTRPDDDIKKLVGRLDLDRFKTTLKGLTAFGDRREGTQRNRNAVDWIETQLTSFGCADVSRLTYEVPTRGAGSGGNRGAAGGGATGAGAAGGAGAATGAAGAGTQSPGAARNAGRIGPPQGQPSGNAGGSMSFGFRATTGVANAASQPDEALRALDSEPVIPGPIPEVYCTKIGTTHPEEMYIVGGHMDGIGYGQAANDDGSGTTLVMELARVLSSPDVTTERTIRFALWNGEEGGLHGAHAYVDQRKDLQGIENPKGSGKYPEPKWLGMVQHDMMMWDHGMPMLQTNPDGTPKLNAGGQPIYAVSREQRPEADVNVEFQSNSKMADASMKMAFLFKFANDKYATDYPASVGPHMTNTDSEPFQDICPAISLRENERGAQIGAGWDPNWHQPTDVFTTYSDKDFKLGLNAAQTTLAAIAQLAGAKIK